MSVEVNLSGALLDLVSAATRHDDPEFSKTIADLRGIQARVVDLTPKPSETVRAQLTEAAHWLEKHGWEVIVRVSHKNQEEDAIYTLSQNKQIVGLAVLHFETGKEAALVNIVGHLNPNE